MTTLMYRLETERLNAKNNEFKLELVKNLMKSLEIFKKDFSSKSIQDTLTYENYGESQNFDDFAKAKILEAISRLPAQQEQRPESKFDIYKERFESSTGNVDNFIIVLEFFKDVVWDYSINLFAIMMGSKNPAAELYAYTKEASKLIISELKQNNVDETIITNVSVSLQNINNQLWKMQKLQRIQNCNEVVNFNLAGVILASSFALATLSIISPILAPILGIQVGFSSVISSLYLAAGVTLVSSASFGMSYLHQADLTVRGAETTGQAKDFCEDTYDAMMDIISPVIGSIYSMLGYVTPSKTETNKKGFEEVANNFINKMQAKP